MVATFDKQSHIKYAAMETSTTLLYVVIQFYPFDMSGTILRRFDNDDCDDDYCNSIQLNLINFYLILTVNLDGCNVTLQSPSIVNFGWNEVSFSITKNKVVLQLNNHQTSTSIKCMILTVNLDQVMIIGEDFEGYIKKFDVNFIPYALTINDKFSDTMYLPYTTFNTVFELSEEQSYSDLFDTIKIPCPQLRRNWKVCKRKKKCSIIKCLACCTLVLIIMFRIILQLELYVRFEILARGNLISIRSTTTDYMSVEINNDVFKLKIKLDEYFNEVSIKFEYIDSSWIHLEIEQHGNSWYLSVNDNKRSLIVPDDMLIELCENYLYIGNFQVNMSFSEVTMTNENDVIELSCIFMDDLMDKDLDVVWLTSNQLSLYRIDCNM
ncbi:uncharacterized protein LOC112592664 [Melanaphis sacchari]|uniref:uncharacterized protein LOC112592664 n=1 Tax=Melanaphis sacchari TaxID=742174 RepID=UPI000DC146C7|nr:uncharacterized protein LOC112592664 [Melanaphis sacchari]